MTQRSGTRDENDTENEQRAAEALIAAAAAILRGLNPDVPHDFVGALFSHAEPEDLMHFDPRALASLAGQAWSLLAVRTAGTPRIRLDPPSPAVGPRGRRDGSVLQIVNDDMPFLLDSVLGELSERGVEVRFVVHPVMCVIRDDAGRLLEFNGTRPLAGALRESFIHMHVESIDEEERRAEIVAGIERMLADVRAAVTDWRAMTARVVEMIERIKANPPPLPPAEVAEAVEFLQWLLANHFTFLGVRDYVLTEKSALDPLFETGLGIMRSRELKVLRGARRPLEFTPEIMAFLREPRLLIVTKAALRSRVHRRLHMDYIGVKEFDREGRLVGEMRIVGLFTSAAYNRSARPPPYLRRKVEAVLARAGFDPDSHSGKALVNVLESYPRDELFQIDEHMLYQFALAVLQLDERPRIRVLPRRDRFDRFVSILVFVPRERYDSKARQAIGSYLATAFKGIVSSFYSSFTEGPLVRVHFIIGRYEGPTPNPDRATLEQAVANIVRTWTDGLAEALTLVHDAGKAQALIKRCREAFPTAYREAYFPAVAVGDIRMLESLSEVRPLGADFYSRRGSDRAAVRLKVWSRQRPIPLSERVPVL